MANDFALRKLVTKIVKSDKIRWQRHVLESMMERNISRSEAKDILINGELIKEYLDDHPFPSGLLFGLINDEPLHVVAAIDIDTGWCYIITAYRPDSENFESDFKTRKR